MEHVRLHGKTRLLAVVGGLHGFFAHVVFGDEARCDDVSYAQREVEPVAIVCSAIIRGLSHEVDEEVAVLSDRPLSDSALTHPDAVFDGSHFVALVVG